MSMNKIFLLLTTFFYINFAVADDYIIDGDYHRYTSEQAAISFVFEDMTEYISVAQRPDLYKKTQKALEDVFIKLTVLAGKKGISPPYILINNVGDNEAYNAIVPGGPSLQANIINISKETVENEESLYFILSHELAHYLLAEKSVKEEEEAKIVYNSTESDCVDCLFNKGVPGNADYEGFVEIRNEWLDLASNIIPTLVSLPIAGDIGTGKLGKVLTSMWIEGMESDKAIGNCIKSVKSREGYNNSHKFFAESYDDIFQQFILSNEEIQLNADRQNKNVDAIKECFNGKNDLFIGALRKVYKIDSNIKMDTIKALIGSLDGKKEIDQLQYDVIFDEDINPIDKIKQLYLLGKSHIKKLEAKVLDYSNLRYLSHEDEADELSTRVLFQLGKENSILTFAETVSGDLNACKEMIKIGIEPSQGMIDDHHHSMCWRIWRADKIIQSLQIEKSNDPT
jgi:hypothetical protein